jgi:hypothetical protein
LVVAFAGSSSTVITRLDQKMVTWLRGPGAWAWRGGEVGGEHIVSHACDVAFGWHSTARHSTAGTVRPGGCPI